MLFQESKENKESHRISFEAHAMSISTVAYSDPSIPDASWSRHARLLHEKDVVLILSIVPHVFDSLETVERLYQYCEQGGLPRCNPNTLKEVTLQLIVPEDLCLDLSHSQFALFENLMQWNFADFRYVFIMFLPSNLTKFVYYTRSRRLTLFLLISE